MIVGFEKPPLDEALLVHFGVRGMKWGIRKKRRDEDERKTIFNKKNAKRVAIGAGVVAGAVATAYLLKKYGGRKLSSGSPKSAAVFKQEMGRLSSGTNPFIKSPPSNLYPIRPMSVAERDASTGRLAQTMGSGRYLQLMGTKNLELRNAAAMDQINKLSRQPTLVPQFSVKNKAPSRFSSLMNRVKSTRIDEGIEDLATTRRNLNDPNYVWNL